MNQRLTSERQSVEGVGHHGGLPAAYGAGVADLRDGLLLPVLNVDGYLAWEIYQDSFTTERFNAFIEIFVLPLMRPYSEDAPCCVLVMDNHSIHYSEELEVMCERKGIRPV